MSVAARLMAVCAAMFIGLDASAAASIYPTGVTRYDPISSAARRLPNGNTLIDEGMNGRLVTPSGEIVWEYVSPYFGPTADLGFATDRTVLPNQVYRSQPVPYSWVRPGTVHAERAVVAPDLATFRVPGAH